MVLEEDSSLTSGLAVDKERLTRLLDGSDIDDRGGQG